MVVTTREEKNSLVFFVNGKKVVEANPEPEWTLLYYLRYKLRLCGTKEGCSEGGCGACTVMVSRKTRTGKILNLAVNACLTPLCSVHGAAVVTVEGIGSLRSGLHPVQERIAKSHGSQCGFCTPGFVMSMYALLRNNSAPTEEEMETAFQGNLCRCTGYRPILQGFLSFCKPSGCCMERNGSASASNGAVANGCCKGPGAGGGGCCKNDAGNSATADSRMQRVATTLHDESEFKPYDPSQDSIFPPELALLSPDEKSVSFAGKSVTWHRPSSLQEILEIKHQFPNAKIVAGNSEIGVDAKFRKVSYSHFIHVTDSISELKDIQEEVNGVRFGAGVTLSDVESYCQNFINKSERKEGTTLVTIFEMLQWFAGRQIRNVATMAGNLVTASPISDLNPIFIAAGASVTLASQARGTREVKINEEFFTGYRRTVISQDEVVVSIFIPHTLPSEYFWAAKQARRKEDDISIVNAAMRGRIGPDKTLVEAVLVFGGMGPTTKVATVTSSFLQGKSFDSNLLDQAFDHLQRELYLPPDVPGGMPAYRGALAVNLLFKFHLHFNKWLSTQGNNVKHLTPEEESALRDCHRPHNFEASQLYQIVPQNQPVHDLIGRPIVHAAGLKHATGEAIYVDDTPVANCELFGAFVLSTRPCGKILKVDPSKALSYPGVVAFFSADDLPKERNLFGCVTKDEPVFASGEVECCGQIIGFLVAESQKIADQAVDLVHVEYEVNSRKPIITIEDAIEHGSYFSQTALRNGNESKGLENSEMTIEGTIRTGGQEHFYMETQSCICYPKEDDEVELLVATQSPTILQSAVSYSLGVAAHKVIIKCRRMGGGFGGKETRTAMLAIATSLAASRLRRPVRCVLNRVEDMKISGFRHPFLCRYKAGFSKEGKIHTIKAEMYANAGISLDLSDAVMVRALMSIDGGYYVPNWDVMGYVCKTNLPSNTAFRGFGGPQGSFIIETIFDDVAGAVGRSTDDIRKLHLYNDGEVTPYDTVITDCTVRKCWEECERASDFQARKESIEEFNARNRYKKRGISILPTKHLIGFTEKFLNQAGALVLIYKDGSVALNHGGTEMGQGLHTKMIQIASRVLEIPAEKIYFSESATDKVPNTSSTAGSLSSDLNGPAVIDACQKLLKRLKPYKDGNPNGKWEDWVIAAYFDRVSLAATGFYNSDCDFDVSKKKGKPFNYITYGVGCSEVEIDCLTGDHTVLRTDIVMDLGESMNPAIDIGQIEGGFVQGYGLFTLEELLYTPNGQLLTKGPGMYKIPSVRDIPKQFHVSLLRGASNPRAVYSSKAVGEPPLYLGASVFFAIKEAIRDFRVGRGLPNKFRLDAPATAERILLSCQGQDPSSNNSNGGTSQEKQQGKPGWSVVV